MGFLQTCIRFSGICEGDCDDDSDAASLVCFARDRFDLFQAALELESSIKIKTAFQLLLVVPNRTRNLLQPVFHHLQRVSFPFLELGSPFPEN
jgi:hypothetical protein